MSPEDIKWNEWARIFVGELPPIFFIEVMIRTFLCYVLLVISLRILGKRVAAQFSRNEFTAIVSLSAAVGVPILAPDKGLLPAGIIALVIVLVSKCIARLSARNRHIEELSQGTLTVIVEDGTIAYRATRKMQLSKKRIFAQLRSEGILHLGEVAYLFMEPTGKFSLIKKSVPRPGLCTLPDYDTAFRSTMRYSGDVFVCDNCGKNFDKKRSVCPNCSGIESTRAVEGLNSDSLHFPFTP
jgi:uncharacterized membrane protein YcaP (DUF421 family)